MGERGATALELAFIYSLLDFQFECKLSSILKRFENKIIVARSSTGRLRRVFLEDCGKKIEILYINPSLGKATLSLHGALLFFKKALECNRKILFVKKELFEKYTRKSILAPVVTDVTDDVRAGDEVFVVSCSNNELLGIAKALLSAYEIKRLRRGEVAVLRRRVKTPTL